MIALADHGQETTVAKQPQGQRTIAELTKTISRPGCPPGSVADYSSTSVTSLGQKSPTPATPCDPFVRLALCGPKF
jgi:hypothetical protein